MQVDQPVHPAIVRILIEAPRDDVEVPCIPALVPAEHGIGHEVCGLKEASIGRRCEVGNVRHVVRRAPSMTFASNLARQYFEVLAVTGFGSDDQASLGVGLSRETRASIRSKRFTISSKPRS